MSPDSPASAAAIPQQAASLDRVRELDWRFLLPEPPGVRFRHLVMPAADPGLLALAAETGLAERVSASPPAGDFDLLVVRPGAPLPNAALLARMADGGVCCCFADSTRSAWSTRAFGRLLRNHGFGPPAEFLASGRPERPTTFLPARSNVVLAWYLRAQSNRRTPARRAGSFLLRQSGWLRHLALLWPRFLLLAARSDGRPVPELLADASRALKRGGLSPDAAFILTGEGPWSRVAVLSFEGGESGPSSVLKLPRLSTYNRATEHEHAALEEIHGTRAGVESPGIPRPLAMVDWNGLRGSVQTAVPGTSLYADPGVDRTTEPTRRFELAASWLAEFHLHTLIGRQPLVDERARRFDNLFDRYFATFDPGTAERRLLARVIRHLDRNSTSRLPIVRCHGDFGPWNILRQHDRISVIDWEVSAPGPALADLLYLAIHYGWTLAAADGAPERYRALSNLLIEPDPGGLIGAGMRKTLHAYAGRLEIDRCLMAPILIAMLVRCALERVDRTRSIGPSGVTDRLGNPYADILRRMPPELDLEWIACIP